MHHFSKKQKSGLLFLGKFFLIYFALEFLILVLDFSILNNTLAAFEGQLLNLSVFQNKIIVPDGVFSIDNSCTGLVSAAILAAVVFSVKKPNLKTKFKLWLASAAILFVLNLFRLYAVLWTGKQYGVAVAETVHIVSWISTAAFILVVWFFLTKKIANVKHPSELVE